MKRAVDLNSERNKIVIKINCISFGKEQVFPAIDFTIASGERIGLMGRSGSGKTTLLSLIAGFRKDDSGKFVLPEEVFETIQYVPQDPDRFLLPWKSVHQHMTLASDSNETISEILEGLGLSRKLHHRPMELSSGQRKRLALAVALVRNPRLLLIDEAFASQDEKTRGDSYNLLKAKSRSHEMAYVIVAHHPQEVKHNCEIVLYLSNKGMERIVIESETFDEMINSRLEVTSPENDEEAVE